MNDNDFLKESEEYYRQKYYERLAKEQAEAKWNRRVNNDYNVIKKSNEKKAAKEARINEQIKSIIDAEELNEIQNMVNADIVQKRYEAEYRAARQADLEAAFPSGNIKRFDWFNEEQNEFINYIDSLSPIEIYEKDGHKMQIKRSDRTIMHSNETSAIASVFPSENNMSTMVVDDAFFNLDDKTQDFVKQHELGHIIQGIDSTEEDAITQILETKVDLSTDYSNKEIINALEDLKANISPEYHQNFDTRISNIKRHRNANLKLQKGNNTYRFSPTQEFNGTMDFLRYGVDDNNKPINKKFINKNVTEEAVKVGNPYLKQVFTGRNLGALLNLGLAVSDYNEARNAGDGVIKAGAKAGAQFVAGEMLGGWMMPVMLAKQVPTIAISAIETTQTVTRKMNSTSRIQTFGEAQFQDTQQLATMRQAGMELAKMSQYNLQQSIMGNEAQYMHRL